jgi:hypothetical protein
VVGSVSSVCVLYPMLPVSIFLCLVSNVTRVYLSVLYDFILQTTRFREHNNDNGC